MKTSHHMSFLAFLLIYGFGVKNSMAQMEIGHLRTFIEVKCYHLNEKGTEMVYGQEHPLAQTLENFLYLVEKYELANPDKSMKDVTRMLLKNYTIEKLEKQDGELTMAKLGSTVSVDNYWERLLADDRTNNEDNFPYEENELCSLYYMLSHTINDTAWPAEAEKSYAYRNTGEDAPMRASELKTPLPKEQGVVAIEMTNHSVALGRVIAGIYLGLSEDKVHKKLFDLLNLQQKKALQQFEKDDNNVNLFYVFTISDMLALSSWEIETTETKPKQMGKNGVWYSIHSTQLGPNLNEVDICPNVYKLLDNATTFYTYSSFRGSLDGVILGNLVKQNSDLANSRLSQLLRMYYSKKGISLSNSQSNQEATSFCRRSDLINGYSDDIKKEVDNAAYILGDSYVPKTEDRINKAKKTYDDLVANPAVLKHELNSVCTNVEDKDRLWCDTPSDVLAVIDTSNKNIEKQKTILGYLANNLKLWHQGSKMTILSDRRNGTNGLGLEEILPETSCSSCVACNITGQIIEEGSRDEEEDFVVQAIDKFLQDKRDSEASLNGVAGKVLIYFNYAEEEALTPRLERALKDLRLRHHDTTFFAIGKDKNVLSKYARNNNDNTILGSDENLKSLAEDLTKKICKSPAALQFTDCENPRDEKSASYEGLVTPNIIQYWAMNPKYFLKSLKGNIFFDATGGDIRVCHNRASVPETTAKNCKETNSTNHHLDFPLRNPCKGFTEITCGAMAFSVTGLESKNNGQQLAGTLCQDKDDSKCKTLDQIRFKVTHDGIRCSGCSGLGSTLSSIMIAFLLYFIFTRNAQH